MPTKEEEDAQRERAKALRDQIRDKTSSPPKRPESPREFVERRMRETEKKEGDK